MQKFTGDAVRDTIKAGAPAFDVLAVSLRRRYYL